MNIVIKNHFQAVNLDCFRKKTVGKGSRLVKSCHVSGVTEERNECRILICGTVLRETPGASSTRKDENLYFPKIEVNVDRCVRKTECTCKAGKFFCKHAAAICVYVNEENTCSKTDLPMIWNKPPEAQLKKYSKGATINEIWTKKEYPDCKILKRGSIKFGQVKNVEKIVEEVNVISAMVAAERKFLVPNEELRREEERKELGLQQLLSGLVEQQYEEDFFVYRAFKVRKINDMTLKFYKMTCSTTCKNFFDKNIYVDREKWTLICFNSVKQSESAAWFRERFLRITASKKCHQIKTRTVNFERLAEQFKNDKYKGVLTHSMRYGLKMEPMAKKALPELLQVDIHDVGLVVNVKQPFLACSPDGVILKNNDEFEIIEIKCPSSCENSVIFDRAKPLYFPTTDVDMTLAGIRGKLLDSDETIYAARTYSKPTQLKRDIIIYKSKNLPINFLFNNNTGDIKITKDFFLHVNESEVFRINIEAFDSIDPKRAASFQMKINIKLITGEKLKCVDYLTQLCFWNDAKYQVLENQATSFLGVLSSLYYKKLCKDYSISYSILKGPNKNKLKIEQNQFSKTWYLLTNMYLDRDADSSGPHFDVNVACGIQDGRNEHRIISKMVNVTVLDEDDSPVIPQVRPVVEVCLTSKEVRKGEELNFSESLLFNDDDSAYVNHYETQILEDTENVIDLDCKKIDIDILKKTGLYCEMKFKRHYKFKQLPYTTMLQVTDTSLEHNDNRTVIVTIQIKLCKTNSIMEHHTTKPTRGDMYQYIETKILRLAGPFSRVAQPAEEIKNLQSYRFKIIYDSSIKNGRSAFGITEKDGIIYVLNMDLLQNKSLKNVDLIVEWWLDGAKNSLKVSHQQPVGRGSDPLRIIIVDELTETCNQVGTNIDSWPMCASFDSVKKCHEACGVATGGYNTLKHIDRVTQRSTRCTWRGNVTKSTFMTNDYQTCTPDITTCPDTKCDELEKLHSGICPQDCTDEEVLWGEHNLHTNRGIAKGNGVCTCEGSCVCGNFGLSNDGVKVAGAAGKHHKKKTLTADVGTETENEILNVHKAEPVNACGPLCLSSLCLGIICVLIIFTLILCQCRSWQSLGSREHKYISSVTALSHGYGKEYVQQTPINPPTQPLTSNLNSNGIHNGLEFNFTMNVSLNKKYTPDPKWEFPRSNLHIEQILGEGEFGRVLKARALDIGGNLGYSTVAVKTLKENAQNSELDDLISEYELLKEVSHPNVIRLLGVSMSAGGPAYLIIEYAELGSLRNYLRKSRNLECENSNMHDYNIVPSATEVCKVTARDILSFAWQISKGMAYLGDKKLVHRDLAARNVLVAAGKICKISDFGLTRDVYEDNAYLKRSKGRVPIKWMAPESLADHVYTNRSDVWSFGILLWELITLGGSPYPGIAVENLFTLLRSGYRMEKPPNCSIQLYTVMQKCWEIDPTERPSFRSLTEKFENLLEDGVNYLNLDLHAVQNKAYFTTLNETSDGSKQLNIPKYSNGDPLVMNLLQTQANTKCSEFNKLTIWKVSSPTASGGVPMINYQNEDRRLSSHYEVPKNNNLTKTADNLVESNKMHLSYIDMSQTKNVEEKPLLIKSTRSYDQLPSQRITNV